MSAQKGEMNLLLKRPKPTGLKFTEGRLYINGTFECFTLEDEDRELENGGVKVYGKTAIPRGRYEIVINMSTRFGREMILLKDVPQFKGIRMHSGNTSEDTDGCPLVGSINDREDDDWIGASRVAEKRLFVKVKKEIMRGTRVWIDVV